MRIVGTCDGVSAFEIIGGLGEISRSFHSRLEIHLKCHPFQNQVARCQEEFGCHDLRREGFSRVCFFYNKYYQDGATGTLKSQDSPRFCIQASVPIINTPIVNHQFKHPSPQNYSPPSHSYSQIILPPSPPLLKSTNTDRLLPPTPLPSTPLPRPLLSHSSPTPLPLRSPQNGSPRPRKRLYR